MNQNVHPRHRQAFGNPQQETTNDTLQTNGSGNMNVDVSAHNSSHHEKVEDMIDKSNPSSKVGSQQ